MWSGAIKELLKRGYVLVLEKKSGRYVVLGEQTQTCKKSERKEDVLTLCPLCGLLLRGQSLRDVYLGLYRHLGQNSDEIHKKLRNLALDLVKKYRRGDVEVTQVSKQIDYLVFNLKARKLLEILTNYGIDKQYAVNVVVDIMNIGRKELGRYKSIDSIFREVSSITLDGAYQSYGGSSTREVNQLASDLVSDILKVEPLPADYLTHFLIPQLLSLLSPGTKVTYEICNKVFNMVLQKENVLCAHMPERRIDICIAFEKMP